MVKWVAAQQHVFPSLKPIYRVLSRSLRRDFSTIQSGPAKGLRFDAGDSPLGYFLGTVEIEVQNLLQKLCKPGDIVFDIGANVGYFSILIARLVTPDGRVFAFEPSRSNFALLMRNLNLNQLACVEPVQIAISEASGSLRLSTQAYNTNHRIDASEGQSGPDSNDAVEIVLARPLDEVAFDGGGLVPGIIKMDVEGHEASIIRGAKRLLKTCQPLLLIELHGTNNEVADLLEESGYWNIVVETPTVDIRDAYWNAHILAGPPNQRHLQRLVRDEVPNPEDTE